jgi:methylated-DNA-[protein]-cysteine S-methyltransferase
MNEGTAFQKKVWSEIDKIARGEVMTYSQIAKNIGHPKAARAVANACGANPNPIIVPCHRVIRSDGELGGYSGPGGIKKKKELLENEGISI